jgi:hypothetical protein
MKHCETQQNDTQHNKAQQNDTLHDIMLTVAFVCQYSKRRYPQL